MYSVININWYEKALLNRSKILNITEIYEKNSIMGL